MDPNLQTFLQDIGENNKDDALYVIQKPSLHTAIVENNDPEYCI
jgi:hypothetical protein